ncbi:MAG: nuoC [Francisellaceae bacterium]|nr:nuoC [Francisellaceae bacterium]
MINQEILQEQLHNRFGNLIIESIYAHSELTLEIASQHIMEVALALKEEPLFLFEQLTDLVGVDYLHYGISEWETFKATGRGFERGVSPNQEKVITWDKPRFAVVYQLLSFKYHYRLRLKTFVEGDPPRVPSLTSVWNSANWYEREAFDLFGILFENHPDLRRLLTDYGFIGHPFRKDYPLSGHVEMRYDATLKRVIYEPVDIEPRVLVPKTIRRDNQYTAPKISEGKPNG